MRVDKQKPEKPRVREARRYPGGLAINIDRPDGSESRLAHAIGLTHLLDHLGPDSSFLLITPFRAWRTAGVWTEAIPFDENRVAFHATVSKFHHLVGTGRIQGYWLASHWTDRITEGDKGLPSETVSLMDKLEYS